MAFDKVMLLLGVAVGVLLLLFGVYLYQRGVDPWRLSFCIGFGIILASFGTVANVKTKLWTITGAGAIAIILFWITSPKQQYTVGFIDGNFPEGTITFVRDGQDVPGGFLESKKKYRMVLLGDRIESQYLQIEIKLPTDRNSYIAYIKQPYINKLISDNKQFTWFFRDLELLDADLQRIPVLDPFAPSNHRNSSLFSLFNSAEAMTMTHTGFSTNITILVDNNLRPIAEKLLSHDYQMRRDARNTLVDADVTAIRPVLDVLETESNPALEEAFDFYQVLINIMRRHGSSISKIRETLTNNDVKTCLLGVASGNREVSTLATEFLHGIADKRALGPSLELLKTTHNPNTQRNAVLVIQSLFFDSSAAEKDKIVSELKTANVGEKARDQIESFITR